MSPTIQHRRARRFAAVLVAACAIGVPLQVASASVLAPNSNGGFMGSPVGYLGCVDTSDGMTHYCFVSYRLTDGPQAGMVDVVARKDTDGAPLVREEAVASPDALATSTDPVGRATVTLSVTLPTIGDVALTNTAATTGLVRVEGNQGCVGYPVQYQLESAEPTISGALDTTGTVAGQGVTNASSSEVGCDTAFVGATTGTWAMAPLI